MNSSLTQIIINSGQVGIVIWFWLFVFTILGVILGMSSIVKSTSLKEDKHPLGCKLLIWCIVATLLTGAMATITGYGDTFAGLCSATGAEKAAMLHLSMHQSRVSFYFAMISAFIQLSFLIISHFILHLKLKKLSISHLSPIDIIKNIPILVYGVILISLPLVAGVVYTLWGIEKMVLLKPGDSAPMILGMDFLTMMNICFISGCIGLILLFVLLIKIAFLRKSQINVIF